MMNVMKSDVARDPLQNRGKLVIRAPLHRGFHIAPFFFVLKVGILELMLDIEQPDAQQAGYEENRPLNHDECLPADGPDQQRIQSDQEYIRQIIAHALPASRSLAVKPVLQQKNKARSESEHDERIPINPVSDSPPQ